MIHKIVNPNYFTMSGNSIRRSLQYDGNMPKIDILVRESIQNSFDALKEGHGGLSISFSVGDFETAKLSRHLTNLEDTLVDRYGSSSEYLEIRDVGTMGLDGPLESKKKKDYGNLIKLVYEIGEKQLGEGKGGSWGYGKTNYYNFGMGLVIFYSRTVFNETFQNRLVVSLIEDTDHHENMLIPEAELGISFWGAQGVEDEDQAIPITDDEEIEMILSVFGLSLFEGDDTGTSIIIPFIDRAALTKESVSKIFDDADPETDPEDFQYYVELAVQRWYFPRLMNLERERYLRFVFNGKLFTENRMLPLFKIMREIYNETFLADCKEVRINSSALRDGNQAVAKYSSRTVDIAELGSDRGMTIYNMLQIRHNPSKPNSPIGFRCRSLGMVNSYDVDEGIVRGAVQSNPGECLIVGMRPIPDVIIVDKGDSNRVVTNLEQYLRMGENPAHTIWNEVNLKQFKYVAQSFTPHIKQDMIKAVANVFAIKTDRESIIAQRNTGLSRMMGKLFLPYEGFGKSSTAAGSGATGKSGGGSGASGGVSPALRLGSPMKKIIGGTVYLDMLMEIDDGNTNHSLILSPSISEDIGNSVKSIGDWEEKCGIPFPVSISSFSLLEINGEQTDDISVETSGTFYVDPVSVKSYFRDDRMYAVSIEHPLDVKTMLVRIKFDDSSRAFKLNFSLSAGGV